MTRATFWRPCFFEENSYAVYFLKSQGVSRLDVLSYISHGISKISDPEESEFQSSSSTQDQPNRKDQRPGKLYHQPYTKRPPKGLIDPLIGRDEEILRTLQILGRRTQK